MRSSVVVLLTMFFGGLLICGCESGGSGGTTTTPQGNAALMGTYEASFTSTMGSETETISTVLEIGSDVSKQSTGNYLYIPATGSTATYSGEREDGTELYRSAITITGRTIRWQQTMTFTDRPGTYTHDITLDFAADYNSGTLTGTGVDETEGPFTNDGTLTRI